MWLSLSLSIRVIKVVSDVRKISQTHFVTTVLVHLYVPLQLLYTCILILAMVVNDCWVWKALYEW